MLAASSGHLSCVEPLVSHGADVNLQNSSSDTALMLAKFGTARQSRHCVEYLRRNDISSLSSKESEEEKKVCYAEFLFLLISFFNFHYSAGFSSFNFPATMDSVVDVPDSRSLLHICMYACINKSMSNICMEFYLCYVCMY